MANIDVQGDELVIVTEDYEAILIKDEIGNLFQDIPPLSKN